MTVANEPATDASPGPAAHRVPVTEAVHAQASTSPTATGAPPHQLAPAAVWLWRLQGLTRLLFFGLPLAVGLAVGLATVAPAWVGASLAAVMVVARLGLVLAWPPLRYDAFRYGVRGHDLLVQSGVLYRRWSSVPLSRIQHVDTRQGPLERLFGVQSLLVFTAAGVSADGVIPALTDADAQALRDELSRRGGDDGV